MVKGHKGTFWSDEILCTLYSHKTIHVQLYLFKKIEVYSM